MLLYFALGYSSSYLELSFSAFEIDKKKPPTILKTETSHSKIPENVVLNKHPFKYLVEFLREAWNFQRLNIKKNTNPPKPKKKLN